MPLTLTEIQESLKNPSKKQTIQKAVRHQERLKFHTEPTLDRASTSPRVLTEFLQWVQNRLPADKYAIFCELFRYPVKTVKETDRLFAALSKVFDGQNPVFKYDFLVPEAAQDWEFFRKERIESQDKWRVMGMQAMKQAINAVVIVDLPSQQANELPEPYFYFCDIENVLDYKIAEDGNMDWIIFYQDETTLVVLDDVSYRMFRVEKDEMTQRPLSMVIEDKNGYPQKITLLSTALHDLTYCPARFFWSDSLSKSDPDVKISPITTHLPDLDWLLYFLISKQHLDTYAGYPIYSAFIQDCDFKEDTLEGFYMCSNGFLKDQNDSFTRLNDGSLLKCPKCNERPLAGPGSLIQVPPPGPENDNADLRNPVSITTVDKQSLDYQHEEITRIRKSLYEDVTGYGGEPIIFQAMNEKQIMSAFENRTAILRSLKKNFEIIQEWTEHTICKLRYGQVFEYCVIDYGTDFYLYDPGTILDMYEKARAAELDDQILDMLQDQYYATKYRNNADQLRKVKIENNLDPLRHITKTQATGLYTQNLIEWEDYSVKINFSTFIKRFEREQAPLLNFGASLPFDKKVEAIKKIIISYVKNKPNITTTSERQSGGSASEGAGEGGTKGSSAAA